MYTILKMKNLISFNETYKIIQAYKIIVIELDKYNSTNKCIIPTKAVTLQIIAVGGGGAGGMDYNSIPFCGGGGAGQYKQLRS